MQTKTQSKANRKLYGHRRVTHKRQETVIALRTVKEVAEHVG